MMSLAAAVRAAREARGMTRTALARAAGCSVTQISRIESGERLTPKARLIDGLADALGIERVELFLAHSKLPPNLVADLANPAYSLAIGDGHVLPRETGWILRRRHIALLVAGLFPEPARPPVSPSDLARRRGLRVEIQEGAPSAAVLGEQLTCRGDSDASRRFAVAHALGHVILEEEPECKWGTFSQQELEANAFASYLLLPRRMLDGVISSLAATPLDVWAQGTGPLLEGAAKRCGVPTWLLARRAAEEGLLAQLAEVGDL